MHIPNRTADHTLVPSHRQAPCRTRRPPLNRNSLLPTLAKRRRLRGHGSRLMLLRHLRNSLCTPHWQAALSTANSMEYLILVLRDLGRWRLLSSPSSREKRAR